MAETQKPVKKEAKLSWRVMRYVAYAAATVFAIAVPWITVDGNHLFLLSFDKLKLHLGFVQFDMQEMYLMPFLLMIMFLGVFGMTVMGGRVFCGWVCPQTVFRVIYRDLIETKILGLRKRIKNKQQEPDMSKAENKVKKAVAVAIWTVLATLAAADFMWFFVPPEDFFLYMQNPADHLVLVGFLIGVVVFLIYDIIFLKENFCVYVCPYSRIQSVLYDDDTVMAIYNPHRGGDIYNTDKEKMFTKQKDLLAVNPSAECTACESCVTVCPTHIDIRQGLQLECINCLECVDACTDVMGKLGKESLVVWSSEREIIEQAGKTRYFRPKIIGYGVILVILVAIIGVMGSKKEHMLLNVNKETRLYAIEKTMDGKYDVKNSYVFLLQNTQDKEYSFYFDIIPPKGMEGKIKIDQPTEPFKVQPDVKKKKIVTLSTTDMLVDDLTKDTVIPITIKAYALDKNGKVIPEIVVFRKANFIYPREDMLKKETQNK
jgi:cytochrome c oxidase accessory protein FixG